MPGKTAQQSLPEEQFNAVSVVFPVEITTRGMFWHSTLSTRLKFYTFTLYNYL